MPTVRNLAACYMPMAFGSGARDKQRFRNKRTEMFWTLRELLETDAVALPDDEDLVADLSALTYQFTQDGKLALDGKDEIRKRLGHVGCQT